MLIETADGEQKTILNSATPLRDESGEIVGAVNVSEDVTEAKAAGAARRRPAEEQVHRAQKMEAVGRLAGGIAHDFNNLLTGILSYSDLILQELRPADPIRADVEQIRDAGQRAANLTRQLLAFSRRQFLQPQVLSLNATVADLDPMLRRLLGPAVTLETELDPALGNVMIDPNRLEQVLVNLIVNAREAMPEGGRIRISSANWRDEAAPGQRAGGARPQEYVSVWVSDTGIGMDAATQSRIFEPFFTTKQAGSGTGLGLSTVYGIVEQSGGHITVESAPGQGATFRIQLPRHVRERAEPGAGDGRACCRANGDPPAGRRRGHGPLVGEAPPGAAWLHRHRGPTRRRGAEGGRGVGHPHRPGADRPGDAGDGRAGVGGAPAGEESGTQGALHVRLRRQDD